MEGLLRYLLPPETLRRVNFSTLRFVPENFVSEHLKRGSADLLCTVEFDGVLGYIYVILEHKSHPDPLTAFQILGYMVQIWESHLKIEGIAKNGRLPFVLPLVLYHGENTWEVAQSLSELIETPPGLERFIPELRLWMEDLNRQDDEHLKSALNISAALLILKHIVSGDLEKVLVELLPLWQEMAKTSTGLGSLATIFRYVVAKGKHVRKNHLRQILSQLNKEDVAMGTIAEEWILEGEVKGEIKGEIKGKRQNILQVLEVRFLQAPGDVSETLTEIGKQLATINDIERLDTLLREAVRTASLDVFVEALGR